MLAKLGKEERTTLQGRLAWVFRPGRMLLWRRAVEAKRDAAMVFKAACEGRPMELARRLRVGIKAGGLQMRGVVDGLSRDRFVELLGGKDGAKSGTALGERLECGPLSGALLGGHDECVRLLAEAAMTKGKSARVKLMAQQDVVDPSLGRNVLGLRELLHLETARLAGAGKEDAEMALETLASLF